MKQSLIIFFKEILASINHREQQRTVPHGNDLPSQASSPGHGAYQQFLVHKQSASTKFLPWSVPCLHHSVTIPKYKVWESIQGNSFSQISNMPLGVS